MRKFLFALITLVAFSLSLNAIPYRSNEPALTPEQIVMMATTPNINMFAAQWQTKTSLIYPDNWVLNGYTDFDTECAARYTIQNTWFNNPNHGFYTSAWYFADHGGWWTHADVSIREYPNAFVFIGHTNYGVNLSVPQCGDPEPDSISRPQRPF